MKKNMGIGVVLFVLSICNLVAQDNTPTAAVSEAFSAAFPLAVNPKWTKKESLQEVTFHNEGRYCIAFLNPKGEIVSSGRRMSTVDELPLQVRNGLKQVRGRLENKYGAMALGSIFEMITGGQTEYFVPMQNDHIAVLYTIGSNGTYVQRSKSRRSPAPEASKGVLARKQ